jgi:hypothetical protein
MNDRRPMAEAASLRAMAVSSAGNREEDSRNLGRSTPRIPPSPAPTRTIGCRSCRVDAMARTKNNFTPFRDLIVVWWLVETFPLRWRF